ncbi:MAG: hypothetical protein Q4G64_02385 [bacterium]|nr:hypothetical protein [bacterium]
MEHREPKRAEEPRRPQGRWARIGRIVLIGILALALIAAGGHLLKRTTAASAARTDVREGLPSARAALSEKSTRLQDLVEPILGTPQQSATRLDCDFSTRDRGWFPYSYFQNCTLVTRTVYEVGAESSRELGDALDAADTDGWLGFPEWGVRSEDTCRLVKYSSGNAPGEDRIEIRHFPPGTARSEERGCGISNAATSLSDDDTHLDLEAIDPARGWVMTTLHQPVSRTELGCSFPPIIFCNNPLSRVQVP